MSKICSELNILYQEPNQDDKKLIDRCMNRIKKNHIKIFNALKSEDKSNNKNLQFNSKSFSRTKFLKYSNNKYKSKIAIKISDYFIQELIRLIIMDQKN